MSEQNDKRYETRYYDGNQLRMDDVAAIRDRLGAAAQKNARPAPTMKLLRDAHDLLRRISEMRRVSFDVVEREHVDQLAFSRAREMFDNWDRDRITQQAEMMVEARRRKDDLAEAAYWARYFLSDRDNLVLDTETTGLDGYMVEIGVINVEGETVFHSMLNPQTQIEAGAMAVHGITESEIADAPTFDDIEPKLRALLAGKRVAIYNAPFDMGVLRREVRRATKNQLRAVGVESPNLAQISGVCDWWIGNVQADCAMHHYATFFGAWSDYRGSYKWQRLNGGHRALDDCRACLKRIEEMAASDGEKS